MKLYLSLITAIVTVVLVSLFIYTGCSKDETPTQVSGVIGKSEVEIDVTKATVRTKEAPFGNLICDAYMDKFPNFDIAFQNGGNIRTDKKYPPGDITEQMINDILEYNNKITFQTITALQLKSVLERSVSSLPGEKKGWFLQTGSTLYYKAICDTSVAKPQIIDDKGDQDPTNDVITREGTRIVLIKVKGNTVYDKANGGFKVDSLNTKYKVINHEWMSKGGDGLIAFRNAGIDSTSTHTERSVVIDYIKKIGTIKSSTPSFDPNRPKRIEMDNSCIPQ